MTKPALITPKEVAEIVQGVREGGCRPTGVEVDLRNGKILVTTGEPEGAKELSALEKWRAGRDTA